MGEAPAKTCVPFALVDHLREAVGLVVDNMAVEAGRLVRLRAARGSLDKSLSAYFRALETLDDAVDDATAGRA